MAKDGFELHRDMYEVSLFELLHRIVTDMIVH